MSKSKKASSAGRKKAAVRERGLVYRSAKSGTKFTAAGALSYKVIVEPCEEGGFTVFVPSLAGCISEGDTYQEAIANIKDAINGWIEVSRQFGDSIPSSDVIADVVQVSL